MKHRLLKESFLSGLLWMLALGSTTLAQSVDPVVIPQHGLAGVHNFRIVVLDAKRFAEMFSGDTLNFTFQPTQLWGTTYLNDTYASEVIVRSSVRDMELMRFYVDYGKQVSDRTDSLGLATDGTIIAGPLDAGYVTHYRQEPGGAKFINGRGVRRQVTGTFTTSEGNSIYGTSGIYDGMFAVAFDYSLEQFGDSLRFGRFGDTVTPYQEPIDAFVIDGSNDVHLIAMRQYVGQTLPLSSYRPIPGIGQILANIEFLPGGTEIITMEKAGKSHTFPVEYVTLRVRNTAVHRYDTVVYNYSHEFAPDQHALLKLDTTVETSIPLAQTIAPGNYALYAYGWFNRPSDSVYRAGRLMRLSSMVGQVGTPFRYYLPATDSEGNTLHFTHRLLVNGAEVLLDGAGMGSYIAVFNPKYLSHSLPVNDVNVGDRLTINFTGGTLGLPEPGATVRVYVPGSTSSVNASTSASRELALSKVQPNPVTSIANISFVLPTGSDVSLRLVAPDGREVQTIADGAFTAGAHTVRYSSEGLPNGMYFVQLQCSAGTVVEKLVVAR